MKIYSNTWLKIFSLVFNLILVLFFISCNEDTTPSLANLIGPSNPIPQITSLDPPSEALAGYSKITINGSNFLADTSANLVFFGTAKAKVLQASTTQLVVQAPNVLGDTLKLKIASAGDLFSNIVSYKLKPAVSIFYTDFQSFEKPHGITTDNANNVYVSIEGDGVKKINTNLELTDYAAKGTETFWSSLKYGKANTIYSARTSRGVWQIFENTQPTSSPWALTASGTRVDDLDFDSNLNIWTVGAASNIFIIRINPSGESKTFQFNGSTFRAVRFFNNSLYVGGLYNGIEGVWSIPIISADSLGTAALYFDLSANFSTCKG